jgi:hypothetical protein
MVLAAEWQVGQVFLAMLELTLFVIWVWLVISVCVDAIASPELSGVAKVLWILFVVVAPFLGVFVYLIARGNRMLRVRTRHGVPTAAAAPAVLSRDQVDAIAQLNARRDQQLISAEEYRTTREQILG